jgi:hypothetical protein
MFPLLVKYYDGVEIHNVVATLIVENKEDLNLTLQSKSGKMTMEWLTNFKKNAEVNPEAGDVIVVNFETERFWSESAAIKTLPLYKGNDENVTAKPGDIKKSLKIAEIIDRVISSRTSSGGREVYHSASFKDSPNLSESSDDEEEVGEKSRKKQKTGTKEIKEEKETSQAGTAKTDQVGTAKTDQAGAAKTNQAGAAKTNQAGAAWENILLASKMIENNNITRWLVCPEDKVIILVLKDRHTMSITRDKVCDYSLPIFDIDDGFSPSSFGDAPPSIFGAAFKTWKSKLIVTNYSSWNDALF